MENNEILNEEEQELLTLTDENGNESTFEYLDVIEYQGKEYLILLPTDESGEIVILEIEPVDEENENYISVEDEDLLNAVYDIFKEKYKDVLTFEDEKPACRPPSAGIFLPKAPRSRGTPRSKSLPLWGNAVN